MTPEEKQAAVEALFAEYTACQRCALSSPEKRLRTSVVPGAGNPNADIMVIGDAPGAAEDSSGLPFQGAGGEIIDNILAAYEYPRESLFFTTVVACRATEEKRPQQDRYPTPIEIEACYPRLNRLIEIVDPLAVVIMGELPFIVLTNGKKKLTALAEEHRHGRGVKPVEVITRGLFLPEVRRPGYATYSAEWLASNGEMYKGSDLHWAFVTWGEAIRYVDTLRESFFGELPPKREYYEG